MRCNCESGCCPHHHGDPADLMDARPCPGVADGSTHMIYVGAICDQCATEIRKTAPEFIYTTEE